MPCGFRSLPIPLLAQANPKLSVGVLRLQQHICRQAPLPSGPQCPAILRPAEPRREPLFTFSCEEPPRSNPGCPGAASLKGRRCRPALPASLDFLSFSPKRLQQNCPSIEMFRATHREGPRDVARCRASEALRKLWTVTSFHCSGSRTPQMLSFVALHNRLPDFWTLSRPPLRRPASVGFLQTI